MAVNAGARLDRLPISSFHRRIMWLIGAGMFFDGFNIYIGATVLGAALKSGFSTLGQNAEFVSLTFVGMMLGSLVTGFLGDLRGRRFTYQANLAIFGFASLAAAFAPSMNILILVQFIIGFGLGAENVVGYSTLTEFVPPGSRGKWLGFMTVFVVTGLPVAALLGTLIVPHFGWRAMFVIGGIGALIVWYLRKALPESPRWLESVGRNAEADALLAQIEKEVSARHSPLPEPFIAPMVKHSRDISTLLSPAILPRMIVGATSLVVINTLLYGFVTWLPTFFVQQGLSVARSFRYSLVMAIGAPVGSAIGAFTADSWGRKRTIVGASLATIAIGSFYPFIASPAVLLIVGFSLIVPIYVLVALLFAIYIPELFPTEVRLRAAGICNTFGRGAIIFMPFVVVALFRSHGVAGVLAFMIALLIVQIIVVLTLGVEPKRLRLEEIEVGPVVAALGSEVRNP
ncbi:MAG TPA: MFS transporter [Candidatus Acidoferrales bacterium]|nr:MFS transporter [Candidatus Acidoferrales bacterium]